MEHTDAAQIAALLGALGAVGVLIPRGGIFPLVGFVLLGAATGGMTWALVGDDTVDRLFGEPLGITVVVAGVGLAIVTAIPLARHPAVVPVVLLSVAPFRVPVEVGSEDAFLLMPLYLAIAAAVLALAYRILRGERPAPVPFLLALPIATFVTFAATSFLWTWDERAGGIALAFFVFPFVAGLATIARGPIATWLPRALLLTLLVLGSLFAVIGLWQAQTRTLFFSPSLEVANAYTSFFRVTSLFKDPSLYGRYLVVPMVAALVVVLFRQNRPFDWISLSALVFFLFAGLFYSYSQSSFVALFAVTGALAFFAGDKRVRIVLIACVAASVLAAGTFAAQTIEGRSARDVTSGRSRLVSITIDAFRLQPVAGVGIGGQPRASAQAAGRKSSKRNASHTAPLTVLAELGVVGFAIYVWLLAAIALALYRLTHLDRTFGLALSAILAVVFIHSLLYAAFFEDPVTWGVLGLAASVLANAVGPSVARPHGADAASSAPELLAH